MVFSSLLFIFWFIPIFFALYYLVPDRAKNLCLFIGSIVFYAWGEPTYLVLIFVSIIVNYIAGVILAEQKSHQGKKVALIVALVFDFGMLMLFKYTGFFVQNINALLGSAIRVPDIVLPLGISFYTFQIASYIIDLYRGEIEVEKNILNLGTYLVMFPQLIAGPIVVYKQVSDELANRKITMSAVEEGIGIFIVGLSSKVILANGCGALWDELALIGYDNISTPLAWLGMLAFTLQIYFDFNGYSTMAIGLGKMLGFNIPKNFNYPYVSLSITEFWRRWHMTLSGWFREYVYIPLGGNRKGKVKTYVNLFVVWFLTGFWHGAGWNFIIWGLFFFVLLVLEKSLIGDFLSHHRNLARLYTLLLIGISWVIFAITDFSELKLYFIKLVNFSISTDVIYYLRNYGVLLALGCIFATPVMGNLFNRINSKLAKTMIYIVLLLISVSYLADATYNPFLYFRF